MWAVRQEPRRSCPGATESIWYLSSDMQPQENPEVVVYVVVDEPNVPGQASSSYATELSSKIMTEIFPYLGIEKSADAEGN